MLNLLLAMALACATPSPTPVMTATPQPSATPLPTATPQPTATPLPTPLLLPPEAPPQILAVQLSDPVFHSGEKVSGTIVTSTNVTSVEIHLAGHVAHVPRSEAGVWQWTYQLPRIPFFLWGRYTAGVVALNAWGASAERDVQISVR